MRQLLCVVTHKQCEITNKKPYVPIIVGNHNLDIYGAYHDNTKINISTKNKNYCELTALYWIWKNCSSEFDIIGLCHYRRYFTKLPLSSNSAWFITNQDIEKYMNSYEVILPVKFNWSISVSQVYYELGKGRKKDIDLTRKAISLYYPEYINDFDNVLVAKSASYCNMFIMFSKHFTGYCEWLFNILEYVENTVDLSGYDVQEQRIYGYLSEILLNVWVQHNKLKIKYVPIVNTDLTNKGKLKETILQTLPGKLLFKRDLV